MVDAFQRDSAVLVLLAPPDKYD